MRILVFLTAAMLLFTSATCKKQGNENSFKARLVGKWQFTGRTGGFAGMTTSANPAAISVIEFKVDGKYVKYINGEPDRQGTYDVIKIKSIYTGLDDNAVRLDPSNDTGKTGMIATISNETMMLADNYNDGYTSSYVRVK
ncbi:hypothetical protein ACXZ1K_01525 [Pedobacter sp. PWIIR3]